MNCILKKNICEIKNNNLKSELVKKGYGFKQKLSYYLDLLETKYLYDKGKLKIDKITNKKELLEICEKNIKNFNNKYLVYEYFREKGYVVKDGSTFGFDFRIYTNIKKHTEYVLDIKETYKDSITKIIKSERLANTINAKYLVAIINLEKKITIIEINRKNI